VNRLDDGIGMAPVERGMPGAFYDPAFAARE
jgi:hypothetical protein